MSKVKFVATLAFCAFLTPAFAQSLAEREKYATYDKELAKNAEDMVKECKVAIPVKLDWSTVKDIKEYNPAGYCDNAFWAVKEICRGSEEGLKAVQSKIKSVTCKQSSPHILSLENGELVYGIDFKNDTNIGQMVLKYLKDNL